MTQPRALLVAVLLTVSAAAAQPDAGEDRFERVVLAAQEAARQYRVPGAAVGVLFEGRSYTRGFGVTNVDHPLTVTDETLFQVGSISKTFTYSIPSSKVK